MMSEFLYGGIAPEPITFVWVTRMPGSGVTVGKRDTAIGQRKPELTGSTDGEYRIEGSSFMG